MGPVCSTSCELEEHTWCNGGRRRARPAEVRLKMVVKIAGQSLRIRLICIVTRFVRQVSDCVYTAASLVDVGGLCMDL